MPQSRLTDATVRRIRKWSETPFLYSQPKIVRELRKRGVEVSQSAISLILRGKTYRRVV